MGWEEGGGISLSSNGKIDMNARKIYIVPLYIVKDCRSNGGTTLGSVSATTDAVACEANVAFWVD